MNSWNEKRRKGQSGGGDSVLFSTINEETAAGNWGEWSNDMEETLNQSGSPALLLPPTETHCYASQSSTGFLPRRLNFA